jgi:hypothetical protein
VSDLDGADLSVAALIVGANIDEWWATKDTSPSCNQIAQRLT